MRSLAAQHVLHGCAVSLMCRFRKLRYEVSFRLAPRAFAVAVATAVATQATRARDRSALFFPFSSRPQPRMPHFAVILTLTIPLGNQSEPLLVSAAGFLRPLLRGATSTFRALHHTHFPSVHGHRASNIDLALVSPSLAASFNTVISDHLSGNHRPLVHTINVCTPPGSPTHYRPWRLRTANAGAFSCLRNCIRLSGPRLRL